MPDEHQENLDSVDNGKRRRQADYLEASGFGVSLKSGGPNVILVILILAICGLGIYAYIETQRSFRHLLEELQTMTYLQSLPFDQRPIIYPPRVLWDRINEGKARLRPADPTGNDDRR